MTSEVVTHSSGAQSLVMTAIDKSFPGVQALAKANLSVKRGEVHGLVGENGAGKSTLIKILAGVYERDSGRVAIDGHDINDLTPRIIHDHGVRFIHQELHLVPHFTVAESVFLGQELRSAMKGLDKSRMIIEVEQFLKEVLNAEIRANRLIRDLSVAERKLVQIAHALIDEQATMVVFDEPTAPLAAEEVDQVFKAIHQMQQRNISMIYVSHYLNEITEICDRVTIFRNGTDVRVVSDVGPEHADTIIQTMVGREISELYPRKKHQQSGPRLIVKNLGDNDKFTDVSLSVNQGEILGIAGLVGSGREELIDAIYGLREAKTGRLFLDQNEVDISSPVKAVASNIVLVPRDRRNDGLVLEMSVEDNINLASLNEVAVLGLEQQSQARRRAHKQIERLDIRPNDATIISKNLSGGNQQKVVLARWLASQSQVFILDEPTVGVDIGAKVEIYQLIENLAADGASIVVSSSDPNELLGLCDRVVVMQRGKLVASAATENLTIDSLLALTTCTDSTLRAQ